MPSPPAARAGDPHVSFARRSLPRGELFWPPVRVVTADEHPFPARRQREHAAAGRALSGGRPRRPREARPGSTAAPCWQRGPRCRPLSQSHGGQELTSRGAERARGERLAPVTATSLSPVHPVAQQGAQPRGGVQGVGFPGPGCRPASPLTPWDRAKPRPHEEEILVLIYQRRRQKCVRGTPGAPRVTV